MKYLPLLLFISVLLSCSNNRQSSDKNSKNKPETKGVIPFNISKPDKTIKLPAELREISALSYYKDNLLAAVQDEMGFIYLIDYETQKINKKIKIKGAGDFEGIEIIDSVAYMMKSNGDIYKIENFESENPEITKFNPGFNSKNDCEGLGYNPADNALLVACKAKAALSGNIQKKLYLPELKKFRAVYSIQLSSLQLNPVPKFLLEKKEYEQISATDNFKPSAIAIHPVSKHVYILASAGKLLVILDKSGNYLEHKQLNPAVFRQPEGICFSPDGKKLFIANEGKGKKGSVLVFETHTINQ